MGKVSLFSLLLVLGLAVSQIAHPTPVFPWLQRLLTMSALGFIMIGVGHEFDIDKRHPGAYAWDYFVAMTAAAIPWILCALYFGLVMAPRVGWEDFKSWEHILLLSRFAAPTSAGILFSMLAAAGLASTWVFSKARVIAIFDDVDTILLLFPLQMLIVGFKWHLLIVFVVVPLLLWIAWKYLHQLALPLTWQWTLTYAFVLATVCEGVDAMSRHFDPLTPLRLEVLLPSFVLGCLIARSRARGDDDSVLERLSQKRAATIVTGVFMFLAGASVPAIGSLPQQHAIPVQGSIDDPPGDSPRASTLADQAPPSWRTLALDVAALTVLSNLGKMFPALCYRREASVSERLALGVSLFPRGEVGTGVLVISVAYGIRGPALTAATLSLALNLVCTGLFIVTIKQLLARGPARNKPFA
jgi:Kef-type K+ transport system membrane component KefB